jgi:hypothetical protein
VLGLTQHPPTLDRLSSARGVTQFLWGELDARLSPEGWSRWHRTADGLHFLSGEFVQRLGVALARDRDDRGMRGSRRANATFVYDALAQVRVGGCAHEGTHRARDPRFRVVSMVARERVQPSCAVSRPADARYRALGGAQQRDWVRSAQRKIY